MIVALFPELAAAGGVQRAGRLAAAVLAERGEASAEPCVFLSLNDARTAGRFPVGCREIAYRGFGRSKLRFVAAAMRAALHHPPIIVAFHPHLAPLAVAMKKCAPGARAIVFAHGIEVWKPLGRWRRGALQRCDFVVAPSRHTGRCVAEQQGVAAARIRIIPWSLGPEFEGRGADVRPSARPDRFPAASGAPLILTVGRWDAAEAYKGVDHLIAALATLPVTLSGVQLVVVGAGTDLPRLQRIAEEMGVSERTHFLPPMTSGALEAAYEHCDAFVLPSGGEGFGLVFLEAMSHGKAVIGGAHGGTPDVIEEGVSGYLVSYGDVAQLTQRLQQLLSDEAARHRMGARALARIRQDFTFERFSRDLEALLDEASPRR
jgi:phosphatidylinositol alpha-1,6-mannosyltransferase